MNDGLRTPRDRRVPAPDAEVDAAGAAAPDGYVVEVGPAERIHFLDWGGPSTGGGPPGGGRPRTDGIAPGRSAGILLIHGLSQTAWAWAPVARRTRRVVRTIGMDLRGHGLSDAPTTGYDQATLVDDVLAVAEASGLLPPGIGDRSPTEAPGDDAIVLAGHGFGGIVAAWTAARLGRGCAGLVLVDGGWQDVREATGLEPAEWLGGLDEPPEVLRSMAAYLADRAGFDPPTWDHDQEWAARAAVVELPAGRIVSATRSHALAGSVGAIFDYRPVETLSRVVAPIIVLAAADDEQGSSAAALARVQAARSASRGTPIRVLSFPGSGHNLMRYHPDAVAEAAISLAFAGGGAVGPSTIAP